ALPMTSLDEGCLVAEDIRTSLAQSPFSFNGKAIPIIGSFGVATLRHDLVSGMPPQRVLEEMLTTADEAAYVSKAAGRDRVSAAAVNG
ncbi:MAG: GGDEF domain-containing protein, partial [Alphaproteobacteria bacterium]